MKTNQALILILAIIVTGLTAGCLKPPDQVPNAAEVIEKLNKTYEEIERYEAVVEVSRANELKIIFFKPDNLLIEDAYGVEFYNSSIHWLYDKEKDEVRIDYVSKASEIPEIINFVLKEAKNYRIQVKRENNFYRLNFTPKTYSPVEIEEVWVRKEGARCYPVRVVLSALNDLNKDVRSEEINIEFKNISFSRPLASSTKISIPQAKTTVYTFKIQGKLENLTANEALDQCLSKTRYKPEKLDFKKVYLESKKNGKFARIEAKTGNETFTSYCHLKKSNASVRIARLALIKTP